MRWYALALAAVLAGDALPPPARAGDPGGRALYIGGTIADLPGRSEGNLTFTDDGALRFRARTTSVRVPYDRVTTLEYGQKVSRRYASAILISPILLLAKKRKHYLTVGYLDERGQPQALVFEVSKGSVRSVLVSLEAKTGRRVEYQDEEARKAGKG